MGEIRKVREDRIKVLESVQDIDDLSEMAEEYITRAVIRTAGIEIASKLMEHYKVKKTKLPNEKIRFHFKVEVIVPETPK